MQLIYFPNQFKLKESSKGNVAKTYHFQFHIYKKKEKKRVTRIKIVNRRNRSSILNHDKPLNFSCRTRSTRFTVFKLPTSFPSDLLVKSLNRVVRATWTNELQTLNVEIITSFTPSLPPPPCYPQKNLVAESAQPLTVVAFAIIVIDREQS